MKSQDIRPGMGLIFDGNIYVVTQYQHVTPGNLRAFIQIKARNVATGSYIDKRLRSSEEVEQAILDRREMEYLYSDNTGAVFMDAVTYDQFTIDPGVLGNALDYLIPNTKVVGLMYNGNAISIELPKVVELEITDTPPGIKGATATNQLKEATCETGLKTKVPPFINIGEVIRISTETGEYLSRATDN